MLRAPVIGIAVLAASLGCRRGPSEDAPKPPPSPAARVEAIVSRAPSSPARFVEGLEPPNPPQRIVSLSPAHTEVLFALGVESRVAGVSRFADFPPRVKDWPEVGGLTDLSVEHLLSLDPDLVVAVPGEAYRAKLEAIVRAGVPVLVLPTATLADGLMGMRRLGAVVGDAEGGRRLADRVHAELEAVAAAHPTRRGPRVAVVFGWDPLYLAGPGSFPDELLTLLGAVNAASTGAAWTRWSAEALVATGAEVVIDAGGGPPPPELSALPAVRAGRVLPAPHPSLFRPGPRIAAAARALADRLFAADSTDSNPPEAGKAADDEGAGLPSPAAHDSPEKR